MTTDVLALPEAIYQFGPGNSPGLFVLTFRKRRGMLEAYREACQAYAASGDLQTELFAKCNAAAELESAAHAYNPERLRLHKARLAKVHVGRTSAISALLAEPSNQS